MMCPCMSAADSAGRFGPSGSRRRTYGARALTSLLRSSIAPLLPVSILCGQQTQLVFLLQTAPAVPERLWLLAGRPGHQDVQVHVPAGSDPERSCAVGEATMDDGEQHLAALGRQLEGYVAAAMPGDGELAGRIELRDATLHTMLVTEARRPLTGRVGELVVPPDQFEGRAHLHLHLARRKPLATQLAVGEIRPDALDWARKKTLNLQRGRLDQRTIGVRRSELLGHLSHLLFLGLRASCASSSRRRRSSKLRRSLQ